MLYAWTLQSQIPLQVDGRCIAMVLEVAREGDLEQRIAKAAFRRRAAETAGNGGDLANKKEADLPWALRVRVCCEVASALAFLHDAQVVHRDVKTANVLLDAHFNAKASHREGSTQIDLSLVL